MKKYIPYLLAAVLFGAVVLLFITDSRTKRKRFDERITLRRGDKIPYGTYVAYRNLQQIFPGAEVFVNRSEPGYWDSLSSHEQDQVYLVITNRFTATAREMREIIDFVRQGNDAFISTRYFSAAADDVLGCNTSALDLSFYDTDMNTGMRIRLSRPPFSGKNDFRYPGRKFNSYFTSYDTATTEVLGYDESGYPNFVRLRVGEGRLFVQLEPLAFSNYFLLHGDNIAYYEKALSQVNPKAKRVVWDEYFLYKPSYGQPERKQNWLSVLFRYPALKAALLTALFTLILYTLLEMRRKQRIIPVLAKPRNDSIDFVKTIGRLYYDKGDHLNLARKMASYFLEHVRNRYQLSTVKLDEEFIQNLRIKTSYAEGDIRSLVTIINHLDGASAISQSELSNFYKQLEAFYQTA